MFCSKRENVTGKIENFVHSHKNSGVAQVPVPVGQLIFLRPHQQKLQCLKWKIGAKVRKKQIVYYFTVVILFFFDNNKTHLLLETNST